MALDTRTVPCVQNFAAPGSTLLDNVARLLVNHARSRILTIYASIYDTEACGTRVCYSHSLDIVQRGRRNAGAIIARQVSRAR